MGVREVILDVKILITKGIWPTVLGQTSASIASSSTSWYTEVEICSSPKQMIAE